MQWIKANDRTPKKISKVIFRQISTKCILSESMARDWIEDEDLENLEWLDESDLPNEPSIQDTCHCTPDQTTGHTAGKCNVCGKDVEEAAIQHADSLHKKGSSELAGNGKLTENDCWENAYFNFNEGYKASK